MPTALKYLIAPLAVLALLSLVIYQYGRARERIGYAACQHEQSTAQATTTRQDAATVQEIKHNEQAIPDAGLVAAVSALGILRRAEDR